MALLKSNDTRALFLAAIVVMATVLTPCPAHGANDGIYVHHAHSNHIYSFLKDCMHWISSVWSLLTSFFLTPCREVHAYGEVHYPGMPQPVQAVGVCQPCDKLLEHTTKYGFGHMLLL